MDTLHPHLRSALAEESRAHSTRLVFAERAEDEDHPGVARLFRAVAAAAAIHARNYLRALGEVGSTRENLEAALAGAETAATDLYPRCLEEAERTGDASAAIALRWALEGAKAHRALCQSALQGLDRGENPVPEYWVCDPCGYLERDDPPEFCPVCGAPTSKFRRVS